MSKSITIYYYLNDKVATTLIPAFGKSTCEEIRQHWRDFSLDARSPFRFIVDSVDGTVLPEGGTVEELYPSRSSLNLYVQCVQKKGVRIFGTHMETVIVQLLPQESTEDLTERIKILLNIEEDRVARLLCEGRVLNAETPGAQLANCTLIELDLQCAFAAWCLEPATFHPELFDAFGRLVVNADLPYGERIKCVDGCDDPLAPPAFAKAPEKRVLRLFASEPAQALTGAGEWRATAWNSNTSIAGGDAVCALVTNEALLSGAATGVILERRIKVHVLEKIRWRTRTKKVWPTTKLLDLMTSCNDVVMLDEETLDPHQSLWEAGLQEGCWLCITRLVPLCVLDSKGDEKRIIADLGETLADLRKRLDFPKNRFELRGDDKVLEEEQWSLAALKIETFCVLKALPLRGEAFMLHNFTPHPRYTSRGPLNNP